MLHITITPRVYHYVQSLFLFSFFSFITNISMYIGKQGYSVISSACIYYISRPAIILNNYTVFLYKYIQTSIYRLFRYLNLSCTICTYVKCMYIQYRQYESACVQTRIFTYTHVYIFTIIYTIKISLLPIVWSLPQLRRKLNTTYEL